VWSELELGARLCRVPYVAVTGTNGKTTTVEMVAEMMRAAGLAARACGNIGYPFCLAAREAFQALAVEASSFQLASSESLRPRVSALLNLAPDHLDWHESYPAYARAKARIFLRQGEGDTHVGNRDDAEASRLSRGAPCRQRWFGWGRPGEGDVGVVGGRVVDGAGRDFGRPRVGGRAFAMDVAAATAASLAFGLAPEAVRSVVESFEPLPHRGAVVALVSTVRFVDNSKATNPHAALAALDGLTNAVLIAGGLAKGVDLSPLASAAPSLSGVVAIGEAAAAIVDVFEGLVPVRRAGSMEEAVETAFHLAPRGGTVVLAPACASQDMFRDYRERGDRFASAAAVLATRIDGTRGRAHAR
jgi:UDP-N-acetylmuramoylalanine--D-glutamate ligase